MWVFEFDGESWTLDDYTLDEMAEIEDKLGLSWWGDMFVRKARNVLTLLAVWKRRSMPESEVAAWLKSLTVADLNKGVRRDLGDDLPTMWRDGLPSGGAPETIGSSGAPDPRSAGHPASPEDSPSAT